MADLDRRTETSLLLSNKTLHEPQRLLPPLTRFHPNIPGAGAAPSEDRGTRRRAVRWGHSSFPAAQPCDSSRCCPEQPAHGTGMRRDSRGTVLKACQRNGCFLRNQPLRGSGQSLVPVSTFASPTRRPNSRRGFLDAPSPQVLHQGCVITTVTSFLLLCLSPSTCPR